MITVYDTTTETYISLSDYLEDLDSVDSDNTVRILFSYVIKDIFDLVKKESAYRGRFARGKDGQSLLELYELTDDEEDFFMDKLEDGGREVYQKLLAWAKALSNAYQFNVAQGSTSTAYVSGGGAGLVSGLVSSFTFDNDGLNAIVVTEGSLTPHAYKGKTIYLSEGAGTAIGNFTVIDNTDDRFYVEDDSGASSLPVLSYQYLIPAAVPSILYYLQINEDAKYDLLKAVDKTIQDALVLFTLKEWYGINRLNEDYAMEQFKFEKKLEDLRSHMLQVNARTRRKGFFDQEDTTVVSLE